MKIKLAFHSTHCKVTVTDSWHFGPCWTVHKFVSVYHLTSQSRRDSRQEWFSDLGGPVGVQGGACVVWWKQSLSSHSKTNRLSSEGCTIAQWSARQWLTLRAPSGTCFLLLCNPGACLPISAAPRQLSPILPEGKKRGKETFWSKYPFEHTPQCCSLSSLSFHKAQVAPLHLLRSEARHGGGKATPKETPCPQCRFTKIAQTSTANFSPGPESDQLADVGNEHRGLPKQKTPCCVQFPSACLNQNTLWRRWFTRCRLPNARTRVLLKCTHSKQIQALYMPPTSYSAPRTGCSPPGNGERTSDEAG